MRRFILAISIFIVVTTVAAAFIPSFLGTTWGRKQAVALVNRVIPGTLEIDLMDLKLGGGQTIAGIRLTDLKGNHVLRIGEVSSDASLFKLLSRQAAMQLKNVEAAIVLQGGQWINLLQALGFDSDLSKFSTSPDFKVSALNATFDLFGPNQSSIRLEGELHYNDIHSPFLLEMALTHFAPSDWGGWKEQILRKLSNGLALQDKFELQLHDFPLAIIDELSLFENPRLKHLFQALFGEKITASFNVRPLVTKGIALSLESPHVNGNLIGTLEKDRVTVEDPSHLQFLLMPEFMNGLTPNRTHLLKEVPLKVKITQFSLPFSLLEKRENLLTCSFNLDAYLGSTDLQLHPVGVVNIDHLHTHLDSPPEATYVDVHVLGHLEFYQQPLDLNYQRRLDKETRLTPLLRKFKISNPRTTISP